MKILNLIISAESVLGKCSYFFQFVFLYFFFSVIVQSSPASAQVLFDFDNAPIYTSLPINLTVGGITAHFSATGQGFSIQNANTMGFTPQGFGGRCIYPNSVFLADLLISFDQPLNKFSIMYACQELGCDDAATMKVTAYMNGALVGSNTKTARNPGTWPSDTLKCSFPQGFNSVVVHYNNRPPTCQDYGVIYMADNMIVTPLNAPPGPLALNLTSVIEGFWDGINMVSDDANVYLRNAASPFAKVDSSITFLDNSGNGVFVFGNASAGNYYIVVSHRNSIDTWSRLPQTFTEGGTTNFDFTTAANKAYGSNLILSLGKYCLYSGDENKDGFVDLTDVVEIFNDGSNYISGYVATDVNGDYVVDLQDLVITYNNSAIFISVISP